MSRALAQLLLAVLVVVAPASAQASTAEQIAARIAQEYGVEILRVRTLEQNGRRLVELTVMFPPGNSNVAFQVGTLLVDAETGAPVPRFRHLPDGYVEPPPPPGSSREPTGDMLRQESLTRDRIR